MSWLLFFALAACFVATLIVLDNWEHLRARFSRASEIGRKVANATGSALSFLWRWKLPLLFLIGFVVIALTFSGCVPEFGKSKDTLRAERDAALTDKTVAEHEADMGRTAVELAEETHQDRERVRVVIDRAEEELEHAVSLQDFDALYRAYRAGYDGPDGVWFDSPAPDRSDSPARRAPVVPRADASPV